MAREFSYDASMMPKGSGKRDGGRAHGLRWRGNDRGAQAASSLGAACPFSIQAAIVLGFGLFRGVNANTYLSAFALVDSPFLFMPDILFNIAVACAVMACGLTVLALALKGRLKPFSMPYMLPAALLIAGNIWVFVGPMVEVPQQAVLVGSGLLFGVASIMLSLYWIEVFSCEQPAVIVTQIALGMLVNIVLSTMLPTLDATTRAAVNCVLLVGMAGCAWYVRRYLQLACVVVEAPAVGMAATAPATAAATAKAAPAPATPAPATAALKAAADEPFITPPATSKGRGSYRDAFLEVGDSLVAFFVLEAVIGMLNSFMKAGSLDFQGSSTASVSGMLVGIVAFCMVVFVVQRIPRASTVFRVLMPIIASLLVFLPFLGEMYNLFFSVVLMGSYYFIALLITYLIAETAHNMRVSSYVLMGFAACAARALLVVFMLGTAHGSLFGEAEDTMKFLIIVVAIIYALSLGVVFISRERRRKQREVEVRGRNAATIAAAQAAGVPSARGVEGSPGFLYAEAPTQPVQDADRAAEGDRIFDARCAVLAERGGLTEREGELLLYLARGRTKAYIADALFVSENTVRSHVRNIYAKLGVHTRQELIDLVEAENFSGV